MTRFARLPERFRLMVCLFAAGMGCSSSSGTGLTLPTDTSGGTTSSTGGDSASGGVVGSGGVTGSGGSSIDLNGHPNASGGSGGIDGCVGTSSTATPLPPVLAFLIAFLRVSVIWLNHHGLFVRIRRVDRTLLWLNLGILLACTIVPLPTALLADALRSGDTGDLRVAAVLNAGIAALQSAVWIPIFPYLRDHPELLENGTDAALLHAERIRPWIVVGIDIVAAVLAVMSPVAMLVLWTASLIFLAAPSNGLERIRR